MPQTQHDIEVVFLDNSRAPAVRTGNNAAWMCACGERRAPLIGYSDLEAQPKPNSFVVCPECGRHYLVVSEEGFRKAPVRVVEIE